MKLILVFLVLTTSILFSCKKEQEPEPAIYIPPGATAFDDSDIQFVPYTAESPAFLDQSINALSLEFVERKRTEEHFAWDQTFFQFSTDEILKIELRLRYLQADVSKKTLAIYMPYYDVNEILRSNLFEMPINYSDIENGFFKNIVEFHDTLIINSVERYKVFEVTELVSTDNDKDGPGNCNRIFYNREKGMLQFNQNDGISWTLQ